MVKARKVDDVVLSDDLRLRELEREVVLSKEQRRVMGEQINEIKDDVKDIKLVVDGLSEKLENRFASKWVERIVKGLV